MRQELLVVWLLALRTQAAPCDCTSDEPAKHVCSAKGDPHFRMLGGTKYDFMGRGVYPLVRAATACGCTLSIDILLAANPRHVGASSVVAAALRFGDTTVVVQEAAEHSSLTITGSDNDAVLTNPASASSHSFSGVVATGISKKSKWGWQVTLPGGGILKAFKHELPDGVVGDIFSVFINLPDATAASTSGLCSQVCTGFPPLPNSQCDSASMCLPVRLEETVFPAAILSALEGKFSMPLSTRHCSGGGPAGPTAIGRPPSPPEPPQPPPAPRPPTITKCDAWVRFKRCAGTATSEQTISSFDACTEYCSDQLAESSSESGCCYHNHNNEECRWFAGSGSLRDASSGARYAFLLTEPCSLEYPPPSPPKESPPPPAPMPPPPPAPPPPERTTCTGPTKEAPGTWFSGVLHAKWGPQGTAAITDCQPWCEQQIGSDCMLRMSVLSGHQVSCGFDATPSLTAGTCAVVTGLSLGVTASDITSYHAPESMGDSAVAACFVDPYKVVPCEPDPATACEASGANYTLGQTLCGELYPEWRADCLFDYCAFGGNGSWVNITETDGSIEDEETGRGRAKPPPPLLPPSMPPPPPLEYQMQPAQCIVNPATGKQHCIRLPEGLDINSKNPAVVRAKQRTFAIRDGA